ncbi:MAG TPA: S8 family serine peptidase [Ideonella sp.]|uniref:S8 family peptidase n=1 Tax=Ideonella sp. TaxID=1929293 RepID=UPI002E35F71D|nr:S8 family serine peptidase [Ideonella sp.]HEX5683554.1 S8 family serine peptidase [Ideonella sp.]
MRHVAVLACAAIVTVGVAMASTAGARDLKAEAAQQVVVQLHSGDVDTLDELIERLAQAGIEAQKTDRIPQRPVYLLTITSGTPQQAVAQLSERPEVVFAELNYPVSSDPRLYDPATKAKLNSVLAIGDGMTCIDNNADCEPQAVRELLRLEMAHRLSRGSGVRVAVLDTGADFDHVDFESVNFGVQRDVIDDDFVAMEEGDEVTNIDDFGVSSVGHGTHVTGIVHRIAPAAQLMVGRILDPNGIGTTWLTAKGIFWAIDPYGDGQANTGAHVINLSLDTRANTKVLRLAANVVTCSEVPNRNVWVSDDARCFGAEHLQAVVVAAAGNDASGSIQMFPAAYSDVPGLMAVAASDNRETLVRAPAYFTNSGTYVDLAAPGYGILSQFYDGSRATISGTSMAAPIVAGLAALVRSQNPGPNGWSPAAVAIRIRSRAVSMCGPNAPANFKHVDVAATVDTAAASLGPCPLTK